MFTFSYQPDTYKLLSNMPVTFAPLPYPLSKKSPLLDYRHVTRARLGAAKNRPRGPSSSSITDLLALYGKNTVNLPILAFGAPFAEHTTAAFFPRLSVSRYGVSTNTGTTVCLHCSRLSQSNAQSCGSEYVHSRSCSMSIEL